jgi:hypothetical protein
MDSHIFLHFYGERARLGVFPGRIKKFVWEIRLIVQHPHV